MDKDTTLHGDELRMRFAELYRSTIEPDEPIDWDAEHRYVSNGIARVIRRYEAQLMRRLYVDNAGHVWAVYDADDPAGRDDALDTFGDMNDALTFSWEHAAEVELRAAAAERPQRPLVSGAELRRWGAA